MQAFRIKSLKMIAAAVTAAISIASYQPAQAASLSVNGRANNLFVADLSTFGANTNNFTLVGVTSLGNCATFFGLVIFRLKDDARGQQMFAMALAAASSGSMLSVSVDDAVRDSSGFCFVTGLSFFGN